MILNRRRITGLVIAVALLGSTASAQEYKAQQRAPRAALIGFLLTSSLESPEGRVLIEAFRQGLRERGYVEGQNIVVEYRGADGMFERLPTLATELAHLNPNVIVATSIPVTRAVQQAATTIPIVATAMGDPVRDGFVASLAKPGGNITGLTFLGPELVPRVEQPSRFDLVINLKTASVLGVAIPQTLRLQAAGLIE